MDKARSKSTPEGHPHEGAAPAADEHAAEPALAQRDERDQGASANLAPVIIINREWSAPP